MRLLVNYLTSYLILKPSYYYNTNKTLYAEEGKPCVHAFKFEVSQLYNSGNEKEEWKKRQKKCLLGIM